MARVEAGPADTGFGERLFRAVPLPAVWVGVAIAAGWLALFFALAWWSGGVAEFRSRELGVFAYREFRVALLVSALAGYLPTALHYAALAARRNLADLRPLFASSARYEAAALRLARTRPSPVAGLLGLAIVPATALVIDRDPGLYLRPDYWSPEVAFAWGVGILVGAGFGLFVHATLGSGRRFSELADEIGPVDLLAPEGLAPFARQGLRSALLWLLLLSFFSLNALDWTWFAGTAVVALLGGTAALLLPVRGVHRRIRRAKQAERERVNAAIRGDPGPLAASVLGPRARELDLGDLLAWRQHVDSVREWPFDSPTLLRFTLYLAIPLGSWLGGALVERLLGLALD